MNKKSTGVVAGADRVIRVDCIGNYYNWYTATAGAKNSDNEIFATNSICPKGWKLPRLYRDQNLASYEGLLVDTYHFIPYPNNDPNYANLRKLPLSFVLAGEYIGGLSDGYTQTGKAEQGLSGRYIVNSARATTNHYLLITNGNEAFALSLTSYKTFWGYSVRCVAR